MRSTEDLTAQARIRDTAIEVFARDGFSASIRAIAESAVVSPGLVIHHFGSKEGLRRACDDHVREVVRESKLRSAAQLTPAALLHQLARLDDYRAVVSYLVRALNRGGELARHLVTGMVEDAVEYLRAGVDSGSIRPSPDESARARALVINALGGLVLFMTVLSDEFPSDTAAAFDDYVGEMTGPLLELYSAPLLTSTQLLDTYRNERPI